MIYLFAEDRGEDDSDSIGLWGNVNGFFFAVVDCCGLRVGLLGRGVGPFEGLWGGFGERGVCCEGAFEWRGESIASHHGNPSDQLVAGFYLN